MIVYCYKVASLTSAIHAITYTSQSLPIDYYPYEKTVYYRKPTCKLSRSEKAKVKKLSAERDVYYGLIAESIASEQ